MGIDHPVVPLELYLSAGVGDCLQKALVAALVLERVGIAARVVQGHGGRITACNLRNEVGVPCGLEISLEWPVAPTPAPVRQTAGGP